MDIISPKNIKDLLEKYDAKPSKGLGQNFLIDKNMLEKIMQAASVNQGDTILEVGPGLGVLTKELAAKAKHVIAVEKDATMLKILSETLSGFKNVQAVNDDILSYSLPATNYRLVANIPYYLTSPLIRKLLEAEKQPEEIVLMIQKEVAQRICAKPPRMSLLAVSVQYYAKPEIISYVPKSCFWPAPKIDSAIIKIIPQKKYNIEAEKFFRVVKAGFSQPRKQLAGNLARELGMSKEAAAEWLLRNGIQPSRRAETLSLPEWQRLVDSL